MGNPNYPDSPSWRELENTPEFKKSMILALNWVIGEKLFGEKMYWKLVDIHTREDLVGLPEEQKNEDKELLYNEFKAYNQLASDATSYEELIRSIESKFKIEVTEEDKRNAREAIIAEMYFDKNEE